MDESIQIAASTFKLDVEEWRSFYADRVKSHKALVQGYIAFIEDLTNKSLPPIFEGRHLSLLLGLTPTELSRFTSDPDSCYRTFSIPKKSGGEREISVPWLKLMLSQQWLDWNIFRKLSIHNAAHGFVSGRSSISNAKAHLGASRLMTVDIENFFGGIGRHKVLDIVIEAGYPSNVAYLISKLCSRFGALPQGAPSSPQLSNLAMSTIDTSLAGWADARGLRYTRYADDITISGDELMIGAHDTVEKYLSFVGLKLNHKKTRYQFGQRKVVTGVSVGSGEAKLPRAIKRAYKNEAFFALKYLKEVVKSEPQYDPVRFDRIAGRLSYWRQVEGDESPGAELLAELLVALKQHQA
jgi:RNA-directed DNA polymerase